jgi:hypothetical protein
MFLCSEHKITMWVKNYHIYNPYSEGDGNNLKIRSGMTKHEILK